MSKRSEVAASIRSKTVEVAKQCSPNTSTKVLVDVGIGILSAAAAADSDHAVLWLLGGVVQCAVANWLLDETDLQEAKEKARVIALGVYDKVCRSVK